jgi:hypothetical protein
MKLMPISNTKYHFQLPKELEKRDKIMDIDVTTPKPSTNYLYLKKYADVEIRQKLYFQRNDDQLTRLKYDISPFDQHLPLFLRIETSKHHQLALF